MATAPTLLLPDQLMRMLELTQQSDSVELKLTVPASDYRSAAKALAIDPLEAQIRQVYFLDTPDLSLNGAGVVVRARRIQGRDSDSTVKLRPLVPSDVEPSIRSSPHFTIEVDAMPGGYVCSGAMKNQLAPSAVLRSVNGDQPLRKLFSKEQRAFFTAHAPKGLTIDELSILGPILVLKLKLKPRISVDPSLSSCGSTPTVHEWSSSRPRPARPRTSRPRWQLAPSSAPRESRCPASNRRRPRPRWSSSPPS